MHRMMMANSVQDVLSHRRRDRTTRETRSGKLNKIKRSQTGVYDGWLTSCNLGITFRQTVPWRESFLRRGVLNNRWMNPNQIGLRVGYVDVVRKSSWTLNCKLNIWIKYLQFYQQMTIMRLPSNWPFSHSTSWKWFMDSHHRNCHVCRDHSIRLDSLCMMFVVVLKTLHD